MKNLFVAILLMMVPVITGCEDDAKPSSQEPSDAIVDTAIAEEDVQAADVEDAGDAEVSDTQEGEEDAAGDAAPEADAAQDALDTSDSE